MEIWPSQNSYMNFTKGQLISKWCFGVIDFLIKQLYYYDKVSMFWEDNKILLNLHQLFVLFTASQIIVGDFTKFCGLLRIYEVYLRSNGFCSFFGRNRRSQKNILKLIDLYFAPYYFWYVLIFWYISRWKSKNWNYMYLKSFKLKLKIFCKMYEKKLRSDKKLWKHK